MSSITVNQAQELYHVMAKVNPENADFLSFLESKKIPNFKKVGQILHKVAKNCSEKEFVDYVLTNETPAIKLTNEEMEILKGGVTPAVPYIVAGAVGAGAALLKWALH